MVDLDILSVSLICRAPNNHSLSESINKIQVDLNNKIYSIVLNKAFPKTIL